MEVQLTYIMIQDQKLVKKQGISQISIVWHIKDYTLINFDFFFIKGCTISRFKTASLVRHD